MTSKSDKKRISTTIIALNEEKRIKKCLESIKTFSDEIIVVLDPRTTDKTAEIAKQYEAKVYKNKFESMAKQKNYAAKKATNEWLLSIDADEVISSKLAQEIREAKNNQSSQFVAYSMPRKNIIFGKFIKYTRWQPEFDRNIWLYRKDKGKFVGGIHAEVKVEGEIRKLRHAKIHFQYETIKEFFTMMNGYSESEANERVAKGIKFSYLQLTLQPIYNFLVRYFYRLGILDGWRGLVLSYLMAVYHFELWVKIWERQKEN